MVYEITLLPIFFNAIYGINKKNSKNKNKQNLNTKPQSETKGEWIKEIETDKGEREK